MNLTLYYMPKSRAVRVRWLLEELQLPYRLEYVDLFKGEGNSPQFRAIHPLGMLPALRIDDDMMFESGAICQWLADQDPEQALAPALDSALRRDYEQWMFFAVTTLEFPAWEMVYHGRILPQLAPDKAVKQIIPFARERYRDALAMLNDTLNGRDYLVGSTFTAADIMVGYTLTWLPDQLKPFTALQAYTNKLLQRPAYIHANKEEGVKP
jgi:glutathione S-transferase